MARRQRRSARRLPEPGDILPYFAFTPVSQEQTRSATAADPYTVTTVVTPGSTGLTLKQVDQYIEGQETWSTSVTLTAAPGTAPVDTIVYRGADCYLEGNDAGLGALLDGVAPLCTATPDATDPERIIGFYPLSPGSNYIVGYYYDIWGYIEAGEPC